MQPLRGYHPDIAWKMDPALEIWVDVETVPVNIRLAGEVDSTTGRTLHSVIKGLLREGYVDFDMQVDIDPLQRGRILVFGRHPAFDQERWWLLEVGTLG